ncbi:MAG: G8 domain-containing protein [Deltaproteobacteria bacterium]|nr:G8 domain-containing protein [Deltaproteobacteria bacterium]
MRPSVSGSVFAVALLLGACQGATTSGDAAGGSAGHDHSTHDHGDMGGTAGTTTNLGMAPKPDDMPTGPAGIEVAGDKWSQPATWGGKLPQAGDKVVIPKGRTIVVDIDPPALGGISIEGALVFEPRDVKITTGFIYVKDGGRFQLGEATKPFLNKAVITLTGKSTAELPQTQGFGAKVFAVMNGILDIHGAPTTRSWTKLDAEAKAGDTTITVADAVNWKAGDKIVVAPSGPDMAGHELGEVVSVSGNKVTLKAALAKAHYGTVRKVGETVIDVRAEVASISRNIVIQGDEESEALRIGGHMMFMSTTKTTVRLSNIEVTRMGQANNLGRYPVHFHIMQDRCDGCFAKDIAVHDTVQRGIVVHDTAKLLIMNNVVYNSVGHNFIVETQTTAGSTFHHNLAMVNRMPTPKFTTVDLVKQNDDIPSGFWVRNLANVFTENAVGGSVGMGFFFDEAAGGPMVFEKTTVHAAMTAGANRDFNMQSGVLLVCTEQQPASSRVLDLLVYENGGNGENSPAGFWPEHCTSFHPGFTPFTISRVYAVDNTAKNVELRHQSDVYTMTDSIFTGSLLGGNDKGVAVFAQYGGTLTLERPVFAHYKTPVFFSNDILGAWIARFRISNAKFINADPSVVAKPESLTEALDDSFLPKGAYLVADAEKPTLVAKDCSRMDWGDFGTYKCPQLYGMGFLVARDGDKTDGEGEELFGGTVLHTKVPLLRDDGAMYKPGETGFGGYEILYGTENEYRLQQEPTGTFTARLYPMGSLTQGYDPKAAAKMAVPMAQAPKAVYRTGDTGDRSAVPTANNKMTLVNTDAEMKANPENTYRYDAATKTLRFYVMSRWVVANR